MRRILFLLFLTPVLANAAVVIGAHADVPDLTVSYVPTYDAETAWYLGELGVTNLLDAGITGRGVTPASRAGASGSASSTSAWATS